MKIKPGIWNRLVHSECGSGVHSRECLITKVFWKDFSKYVAIVTFFDNSPQYLEVPSHEVFYYHFIGGRYELRSIENLYR